MQCHNTASSTDPACATLQLRNAASRLNHTLHSTQQSQPALSQESFTQSQALPWPFQIWPNARHAASCRAAMACWVNKHKKTATQTCTSNCCAQQMHSACTLSSRFAVAPAGHGIKCWPADCPRSCACTHALPTALSRQHRRAANAAARSADDTAGSPTSTAAPAARCAAEP